MEINTQNMEALLHLQEQQAQLPRRNPGTPPDFGNLLNQQLATGANQNPLLAEQNLNATRADMYSQILLQNPDEGNQDDPDSAVLKAAFDQASGTLALWDDYTRALGGSSTTALRDAWNFLEDIDTQITQMRANPARAKNPELDAIFNEIEILAATEKIKFNRGDYL